MAKIKVSIIIPIYNVEKFLRQCLDSVLNQTLKEIEIICVNDGSTDNSPKILEEYGQRDKRIKIINKKNEGLGAARNTGMEYVTGEYIDFVDSNDWVDTRMFEKLYENGKFNNCDIVMCPTLIVNEIDDKLSNHYYDLECYNKNLYNTVFDYEKTKDFIFKIDVKAYNKIYRTEYLNRINARFPEGLIFEDMPFFYYTYLNARRISLIRDFLYFHRLNRSGSIITNADKRFFDMIKIQNLIIKNFLLLPNFKDYEMELINRKIKAIIYRYFQVYDIYKQEFFELIKIDFEKMNLQNDKLDSLNLDVKQNYLNILNSNSYTEFGLHKEKDDLLKTIKKLTAQNEKHFNKENNQLKLDYNQLKSDFGKLKLDYSKLKSDYGQLKSDNNQLRNHLNLTKKEMTKISNTIHLFEM